MNPNREEGYESLGFANSPQPTELSFQMNNGKKCPKCELTKPKSEFVDMTGATNPRGRYCNSCHEKRMKEWHDLEITEEQSKIPKLKIIFGRYWEHYAYPSEFSLTLYKERDFCPYCGNHLPPKYLSIKESSDKSSNRAHLDHMDPLLLGGEDSIRNVVYVCDKCNQKKKDMSFLKWVEILNPNFKKLAIEIYTKKHDHTPEEFEPGEPTPRTKGCCSELLLDEDELREDYPEPIVDGPPSNKPVTIEINLEETLNSPEIVKIPNMNKSS